MKDAFQCGGACCEVLVGDELALEKVLAVAKNVFREKLGCLKGILTPGGAGKGSARLARLAARLQEYIYTIEFLQEWRNVQADCLSRLSLNWEDVDDGSVRDANEEGAVATVHDVVDSGTGLFLVEQWEEKMKEDLVMNDVIKMIKNGGVRESVLFPPVRPYVKVLEDLSVYDGTVVMRGDCFIPPAGLRFRIFQLVHEGHLGQGLTIRKTVVGGSIGSSKKGSEKLTSLRVEVVDWVKMKSGRIQGGLSMFKGPFRIRQVGTHYVILENGDRWNLRNVAIYQKGGTTDKKFDEGCSGAMFINDDEVLSDSEHMLLSDCVEDVANERGSVESVEMSQKRIRKPPPYLKDFIR
ncbi:hypothetical protein NDU88_007388 [Pleurodeles waltl]|uniref:Uncharacterized protein n=1 Tax=Pleurodeles waltl TaxID=8319 RepID=A0AAV7QKK6_PLEWA|nr:hypothetical protein NDU88_007388 [Pleurodeles waltl]